MAKVSQVMESSHNEVDCSELSFRVREFFLVNDQSLTTEFISQFFQFSIGGDLVDGFSRLQVESEREVRVLRLDQLD
jgi:hypothetical protein